MNDQTNHFFGWDDNVTQLLTNGFLRKICDELNYPHEINHIAKAVFQYYKSFQTLNQYTTMNNTKYLNFYLKNNNNNSNKTILICDFNIYKQNNDEKINDDNIVQNSEHSDNDTDSSSSSSDDVLISDPDYVRIKDHRYSLIILKPIINNIFDNNDNNNNVESHKIDIKMSKNKCKHYLAGINGYVLHYGLICIAKTNDNNDNNNDRRNINQFERKFAKLKKSSFGSMIDNNESLYLQFMCLDSNEVE